MFVTEDAFEKWEEKQKRGWSRTRTEINERFGAVHLEIAELKAEIARLREEVK